MGSTSRWCPRRVSAGLLLAGAFLVTSDRLLAQQAPDRKPQRPGPSDAAPAARNAPSQPRDFKSAHFLIHTDLKSKEAHDLLNRLEVMLGLISKYWGHPPQGTIECYVVNDLSAWPQGSLPTEGLHKIQQGAGVTVVDTVNLRNQPVAAKAIVYAKYGADPLSDGGRAADRGTPQHEAVHAYCGQVFGRTGPLWYAEGMAEMGRYWRQGDTAVHCDQIMVNYIRSQPPKPLAEIVSERVSARGDSWENYAWRWALCHMLENNPNYFPRFRALGLGLLTGQPVNFADSFGPMLNELEFEYRFFLRHLEQGYRVDLCSWDWKRKFKEPAPGSSIATQVAAGRGWQASGVNVSSSHSYDVRATGTWQTSKDSHEVSADGAADGSGRLEGIVLDDLVLSKPFPLSADGSFTPPADGHLYLRCRDRWSELADNRGTIKVKIKLSGTKAPSPNETTSSEDSSASSAPPE
jgi:hypothetical protein